MKKTFLPLALLSLTAFPAFAVEQHHNAAAAIDKKAAAATATGNPLLEEMFALDSAFKEVVSGVALGDGPRVLKAIETLHGKREKTVEALHSGEVKPPKNADKMKEFEGLDSEFHSDLETLAAAASKNDTGAMVSTTKKLLDGCVNCHKTFRE
ncbi:MAG: cytochrome c [Deltaproteobacteria bacterium]|nr:cytochrome c [Deltaproteobacteria bacterium]